MKSGGLFGVKYLFVGLLITSLAVCGAQYLYGDGTPVEVVPAGKADVKEGGHEEAAAAAVEPQIEAVPPEAGGEFTQNHLAHMLARVLAIEDRLPAAASIDDYFNLLTTIGVAPMDGWEVDAPVTKDDLAVVLVNALGISGEVEDTMDPQCYIDLLKSEGVDLDRGGIFTDEAPATTYRGKEEAAGVAVAVREPAYRHGLSFPTVVNSFNALRFGDTVADHFNTSLSPVHTSTGY